MTPATYDDVNLILRLYDLRREEKLRSARAWFVSNFKPRTMAEFNLLAPAGSEANAYARQVTSYWDMVASFITAGVLNQELFFESNRELLLVWLRMKPIVQEVRQTFKDPNAWKNLEQVAEAYARHLGPEVAEAFKSRVVGD